MTPYTLMIACLISVACTAQTRPSPPPEVTAGSIPANLPAQLIGVNDLLIISVYDAPELSRSVRVGPDGSIRISMLQQRIKAEGILPAALELKIAEALTEEGILVAPLVTVNVGEYQSRPISVTGAVRNPITFQAVGPMTLLQAIAQAGGFEKNAGTDILVTRGTETRHISVKGLTASADARWNLSLRGGEEIRVREAGRIFVVGNVRKPGAFASPDAADATVLKAVALAEGLLPFSARQAYIYRPDLDTGVKTEITVDLAKLLERKAPDVLLQPDDILYIPENKTRKLGFAAVERLLLFGSTAGATALIYSR